MNEQLKKEIADQAGELVKSIPSWDENEIHCRVKINGEWRNKSISDELENSSAVESICTFAPSLNHIKKADLNMMFDDFSSDKVYLLFLDLLDENQESKTAKLGITAQEVPRTIALVLLGKAALSVYDSEEADEKEGEEK